jgi:murein DD-endopeptidase MepM/ murein hydrolase activator NlpD
LRRRYGELIDRLERARTGLAVQAVAACTGDRRDRISLLASSGDINDLVWRMEVLDVAIARSRAEAIATLIGDIGRIESTLAAARDDEAAKAANTGQVQVVGDALAAGSVVAVRGFVFPVAGPRRFSNDFGAPRMIGTALAHSHHGTDVFAAYGTPLVAVERGVVTRVGSDRLGGLKLRLVGESGNRYYYAHTSGYAPGLVEGHVVEAGTTLALVGDSGNTKRTSPHVHFQIHPPNGSSVNPYPLLRAVDAATGWTPSSPSSTPAP